MSDVELEVAKGSIHFRGRGPQEWVEEQFSKFFATDSFREKASDVFGNDGSDLALPVQSDAPPSPGDKTRWMLQQRVAQDQLDQLFHRDGENYHFIAPSMVGANNKDRSINAYVLTGLRSVLLGRGGRFTDEEARAICIQYGVYDPNNHSKLLNSLRPEITGHKASGWQLTARGLIKAGELVRQLAGNQ